MWKSITIRLRPETFKRLQDYANTHDMQFRTPNDVFVCILDDLDRLMKVK